MADDNSLTKHLMNLKQQVLRFAAEKQHQHLIGEESSPEDITDAYEKLARKKHTDTNGVFGVATEEEYGHVRVDATVKDSSENPVQNKAIASAIVNAVTSLKTELEGKLQSKLNIAYAIKSSSTHDEVPSAKAVWNALTSYKDLLTGVSLSQPKPTKLNIDQLLEAGYYYHNSTDVQIFTYVDQPISYTNGLIRVEVADDRVIQHVYATEAVASGNQVYYKLNGCEYTRYRRNGEWREWHVAHIPFRSIAPASSFGEGIDENSIKIYENTAGFIFHWDQNATDDDRYTIRAPLYEYAKICEFKDNLPISGPYVFGNLIGRMDIKITSQGMYIRSNVQPGGRIIEMHETYFVPRNY